MSDSLIVTSTPSLDGSQRLSSSRQRRMLEEIGYEWERAPNGVLSAWATDVARMLVKVTVRRGANFLTLISAVLSGAWSEVKNAAQAYQRDQLTTHAWA